MKWFRRGEGAGRARNGSLVIAAAMGIEVRALRQGARHIPVIKTGIGPARARDSVARLARHPARSVAIAGMSGALDPELLPGDLVVASALARWESGRASGFRALDSAGQLADALAGFGLRAAAVPLMSADHYVNGEERTLARRAGAGMVDMESAWLSEAAAGRPLAVLRVIVDGPGNESAAGSLLRHGRGALRALGTAAAALAVWAESLAPEGE